jgi:hypothetical protein
VGEIEPNHPAATFAEMSKELRPSSMAGDEIADSLFDLDTENTARYNTAENDSS